MMNREINSPNKHITQIINNLIIKKELEKD